MIPLGDTNSQVRAETWSPLSKLHPLSTPPLAVAISVLALAWPEPLHFQPPLGQAGGLCTAYLCSSSCSVQRWSLEVLLWLCPWTGARGFLLSTQRLGKRGTTFGGSGLGSLCLSQWWSLCGLVPGTEVVLTWLGPRVSSAFLVMAADIKYCSSALGGSQDSNQSSKQPKQSGGVPPSPVDSYFGLRALTVHLSLSASPTVEPLLRAGLGLFLCTWLCG